MKRLSMLVFFSCLFLVAELRPLLAQDVTRAAAEMTKATETFLATLTPEQRAKAEFAMTDEERLNWHFVPRTRKGLPLKEMTPPQREAAHALLRSGLSERGYLKATTIISLEEILYELENKSPRRDSSLYFFSVFGKPDPKDAWGWRFEGHHLSAQFTLVAGRAVAIGPSFFGANPATIRDGPRKGTRALAGEEDLARKLVISLTDEQKQTAIFAAKAPSDIITGNARKVKKLEPLGLAATRLAPDQAELLKSLLKEHVFRHRTDVAEATLKQIEVAGPEKIFFAWAGGVESGQGHYYRIQGPSFLIEYDNTQNNANHVHAVWRDLENDFGEDLLRKHYDEQHK